VSGERDHAAAAAASWLAEHDGRALLEQVRLSLLSDAVYGYERTGVRLSSRVHGDGRVTWARLGGRTAALAR
jgi:hypothetical protein